MAYDFDITAYVIGWYVDKQTIMEFIADFRGKVGICEKQPTHTLYGGRSKLYQLKTVLVKLKG